MKTITLSMFLTPGETALARSMFQRDPHGFADRFCETAIRPNMPRINKALGQENDAKFLAYAVEYIMMKENR